MPQRQFLEEVHSNAGLPQKIKKKKKNSNQQHNLLSKRILKSRTNKAKNQEKEGDQRGNH